METSEFFMGGIEPAMEKAGIPKLRGRMNKSYEPEFAAQPEDSEWVLFSGPKVEVK
jgi:hypothetical protein